MQTHAQAAITEPQVLIRMDCVTLVAVWSEASTSHVKEYEGYRPWGKTDPPPPRPPSHHRRVTVSCYRYATRQTISCNLILLLLQCYRHATCIPSAESSSSSSSNADISAIPRTVTTLMVALLLVQICLLQRHVLKEADMFLWSLVRK
jgi:hypothetical protein